MGRKEEFGCSIPRRRRLRISAAGSEAVSFGLVPTPVTAYGTRQEGCKLGFSVTASHNPPEYSGLKVFDGHGMELSKQDEARIERVMVVKPRIESRSTGNLTGRRVLDTYLQSMLGRFEPAAQGLKIARGLLERPWSLCNPERCWVPWVIRVIPLNAQISWRFPARLPEPTAQNLSETASIVSALGADLGFAHDGDADRLVMINSAGRVLPDSLTSVMVMKALVKNAGPSCSPRTRRPRSKRRRRSLGAKVVRSRIGKTFAEIDERECRLRHGAEQGGRPELGDVGGRDVRCGPDSGRHRQRQKSSGVCWIRSPDGTTSR